MANFFSKIRAKHGDATAQIGDAVAFLAYFGACLVAGGVAYNSAYDDVFQFDVKSGADFLQSATDFSVNVIWSGGYAFVTILFAIVFAVVFYAARFVWHLWFGYAVLCLVLFAALAGCVLIGDANGRKVASNDRLESSTMLPVVKVYLNENALKNAPKDGDSYENAKYHLLMADNDRLMIFEPAGQAEGEIEVIAIKRSNIDRYEVRLK